ncbi:Holliday junction resolvase RecU [Alkalihalobacillus sp. AL-G]|uniref:Holliday junction resolvase RecU n=1 Tax=Alkalihalobacillus sp. AL-G TaxID=2926399 RepID=UPI00272B38C3|nr:Holliday junction resolvase RecU [Alkalihalobacillus sp. AL-G]WLD91786.1 Holliday junction resolvase RecU [Alkalihalobacillus sp. AL-G]
MDFRYPNRKPASSQLQTVGRTSFKEKEGNRSFANRGMTFEDDINHSNLYYLQSGKAVIHKKPTPVQIVSVDYPKRSAAVIKEAYFKQPSTTDYNGVYRGKYIDFEAKETRNKTSFPLNNFHQHQIEHMRQVTKQDGICFILARFKTTQEDFLLKASDLFQFWEQQQQGGRKSIPKAFFEEKAPSIQLGYNPRIDYLEIIDKLFFAG